MIFGVGLGGCGPEVLGLLDKAVDALAAAHASHVVRGQSGRYRNPAWGGVTRAPFVNAAVVLSSSLPAPSLLSVLHTIEWQCGRVRGARNAARTLDVDLLWWASSSTLVSSSLAVPHPRLWERSFAVIPLLEAIRRAGLVPPQRLVTVSSRLALAPLQAVSSSSPTRRRTIGDSERRG